MYDKALQDGIEIHGDYVAFWGSCLSNFFPCEFKLDGMIWNCSEQYFMYRKATTFGDMETAQQIRETTKAEDAKKLGRKVKGFNDETWDIYKYHYMYKAVYAKFSQDNALKRLLIDYEGKHFVEGSPFDGVWGVKLDWRDERIANPDEWNGQNLLGKILDEVRSDLISSYVI